MSSSLQGKPETERRLVSDEEAVVIPENARATDDSPTVISKQPPTTEQTPSHSDKIIDLARKTGTPDAIAASLRGKKLAHFELIEPIGVGGMAAVIRARDTQLDRFVALKILPPEMAQDKDNIERFHQEAKSAAKLDHVNIARVFFCGEDQGLHFIAFEFVDGKNLRTIMDERGQLPVGESIRYILQVAAGLEHAASRGVVHRDVKPSNIIITPQGQAKLVDMGLARNLERHGQRDLTHSGVTLGTFDYISPEQALEPREADGRSDIYSLGCTFYHMLTGQPPVPDGTPLKKLDHHRHHFPTDPRDLNPAVPEEVVKVLGKMMAKRPKDRYQRPIHLVQHLMQVAEQLGDSGIIAPGGLSLDVSLPGSSGSRPALIVGMALAALVVMIVLLSFAPGPNAPKPGQPTPPEKIAAVPQTDPGKSADKPDTPVTPKAPGVIRKADDLQAVLNDRKSAAINVKIEGKIDLTTTGVRFAGSKDQTLVIEPKTESDYPVLKFDYQNGSPHSAGFIVEGGKDVLFKHIEFLVTSDATPEEAVASIAIRGGVQVRFEQCIFRQQNEQKLSPNSIPIASVAVEARTSADGSRPTVIFKECFAHGRKSSTDQEHGGQAAFTINGPALVQAINCAFRPHAAFFHLREKCTLEQTLVKMQNCAGFVENGPVFRFDDAASAQVAASFNVFSNPDRKAVLQVGMPEPYLVFLRDPNQIQYHGNRNLYHLNGLIEKKGGGGVVTGGAEFSRFIAQGKGSDQDQLYINPGDPDADRSPWQDRLAAGELAFQLKGQPEYDNLGLQQTWRGAALSTGPRIVAKAAQPKVKVVDADDPKLGEFQNLNAALASAVDGDVIKIKHGKKSNLVTVSPAGLTKRGVSVTLRPFDDSYHPVLVLDEEGGSTNDAYMFKLEKSQLVIENMNIVLDLPAGFASRSFVQMGEGTLIFKKCTFTMRAAALNIDLNVVTFLETDKMLKMDGLPNPARVEFHDCFVRGKGDLVALRGCRKLNVKVTGSLIALDGSLLDITAATKAMPMAEGVTWEMDRSSVYTTEALFALHAEENTVLTQNVAKIDHCLLAALVPEQSVVLPAMPRPEKLRQYLKWECEQNFYANFPAAKLQDWKVDFPEPTSKSGKLTMSPKLVDESKPPLWDALPDWFKANEPDDRLDGIGLPMESLKMLLPPSESSPPSADEP